MRIKDDQPSQRTRAANAWRAVHAADVVGECPALTAVIDTISKIADTDCTVMITGESGTGKELMARAIHNGSSRRDGPLVALNCAAIPETLIEAELFGHVRGAFTGATARRTGRIAAADGGTLFLDEIGDMPLAAQAKLLRTLQDGTIIPVGSDDEVAIDVRIVAATHRDLDAMVAEGTFRADLYFRLNVIPVALPPLRDRGGDVELLAETFLDAANRRNRRRVVGFTDDARRALRTQAWPGNVRQLAHCIERAVLLKGDGLLSASDLRLGPAQALAQGTLTQFPACRPEPESLDLRGALSEVERNLIDAALTRTGGNRTEAAALLGLNRTTLVEKIRKYAS